ncbi:MAG: TonB-dependent receptor [Acidobacteriota bacterium]|nr:TonB-dependent receptor [Acidobacteriota bacterium]
MRLLVLLSVFALCAVDASSATLTGSVLDPASRPISRAAVSLFARDRIEPAAVLTDDTGKFRFDNTAPGQYLLQVQAPGFARYTSQSVMLERDATLKVSISLELASQQQQIVVTASATPQSFEEVSKSITVLDLTSIDERDEFFIPGALRSVPGLRVQQLGGPGSFTTIKMRGLRTEDTSILIDGLRFRDPTSPQGDASGFLEDLMVTDIDRVEVLRGSASALYGSNAIGGAVNIITDEGGGPVRGNVLLEGGGLGLFRGRAHFSGGAFRDRLQYSAGLGHLNVTRGVDDQNPARNTSGQGYVSYGINSDMRISARLYGADSFVRLNVDPQAIGALPSTGIVPATAGVTFQAAQADPDYSRAGRFVAGAVTLSGRPAPGLGYNFSYQGVNTNSLFPNGPAGPGFQPSGHTDRENDGTTHVVNARVSAQLGSHQLMDAGYEFEHEHYLNRNFPVNSATNSVADVAENSHALFVQDQVHLLGGKLQIAAAFRTQWFSLSRPIFSPVTSAPYSGISFNSPPTAYTGDISIAYFVRRTGTKLRAHTGRGYRAPSLYERFGTFYSSFGYGVYGDPRLHPNRSIGGDAGIDQTFGNGRMRASATYFYTGLQEVIGFNSIRAVDPFGRFSGYTNLGGGLARGLEASLTSAVTRSLDVVSAYTFTSSRQRTPVSGITETLFIPDHQFSIVATQHVGRRLFFNVDFSATSNYLALLFDQNFAGRPLRFAGVKKVNIGSSYRLPIGERSSMRFFAKIENAFDQRYFESGFRTPGIYATGGLQFGF